MIELTHVGEQLIAAMFNGSPAVRKFLGTELGRDLLAFKAYPEVALEPCGGLLFDGQNRVDVALSADGASCIAIEAKLGETAMTKRTFEKRFLAPCTTSHEDTRVSGKMPAVLERKLPRRVEGKVLTVQLGGDVPAVVEERWILVLRRGVLQNWKARGTPGLSSNCAVMTIEDLIEAYGTHDQFNALVRELLAFDFFATWFSA